jgi:hypothetical protein
MALNFSLYDLHNVLITTTSAVETDDNTGGALANSSVAIRVVIFPASPSCMSSELPTARCEVFGNALFAICYQIRHDPRRPRSATEEVVELGNSQTTGVLIMQYASLITKLPLQLDLRKPRRITGESSKEHLMKTELPSREANCHR